MAGGGRMKRLFDLFVSATALVILSPLFIMVSVAIALDSPGSVFYCGVRTGRWGIPFRMFKFRTMVVNVLKAQEGTTGLGDPRITRVGRIIRKTKIDELPQLINVVLGQMSLVGPRPELPRYTDQFTKEERAILSVRPGITDLSSIKFSSLDEVVGAEDVEKRFEENVLPVKNRLRLKYVRERNFFYDLKIIVATVVVLFQKATRRNSSRTG